MSGPLPRVLSVLEILQSRDQVSGSELATRLQVDLRTVQRYIARLRQLGIPVSASAGVGGAYRLRSGFRLPPMLLTNDEAFALALGLRALRQIGLHSFAPATEGALTKLERAMPEAVRESVRTVEAVIALEPSNWSAPVRADLLIDVATAIRHATRVRFHYQSHGGAEHQRTVEPYAVLHMDERWYMVGHCCTRADLRTFRLDRVQRIERTQQHFVRPQNFDARAYLTQRLPFVQSTRTIDVWIDLPFEEGRQHFALWRVQTEADGTGTRLRCGRDTLEPFAAMLLSLGRRIVVHAPDELRAVYRHLALRALDAAGATSGTASD